MNSSSNRSTGILAAIILIAGLLEACNLFVEDNTEKPVARVKDKFLYMDDVSKVLNDEMTGEDSLAMITKFVNGWINEMLLLDKAELNLQEEQKDFEKQLEKYRNSLLIYTYEKKIIQQQLDTNVLLSDIEDYYLTNQQNFILKQDVFKIVSARFNKNTPQLNKIRRVYRSNTEGGRAEFIDYCHQYAISFYDDDKWLFWEDLSKLIPLKNDDPEGFLRRNEYFQLEDSVSYYFNRVVDFKKSGSISPLSFEKERIKSIIINQRKLGLLKKMKLDLYNNAMAKKDFEIYDWQ